MKLTAEQIWEMAVNMAAKMIEENKTSDEVKSMSRDELAAIDSRCAELIEHPSKYDGKDYDENQELDYFRTLTAFHMAAQKKEAESKK